MPLRLLAALAASFSLGAVSAASAAPVKSIWGPLVLPNGKSAGPVYKALGVDDLQMAIQWDSAAPTQPASPRNPRDPAYAWNQRTVIDDALALGKKYGFSVSVLLQRSAAWANGGKGAEWAPSRARDFADFAYAASKRYPGVRRWMIWGEPSRASNWKPMTPNSPTAPRRYARLLDASYGALKQADRSDLVIGGMTFTAGDVVPRDWVSWMRLPNGKPPRLDLYGHNPFSTRRPDLRNPPSTDGNYDFSDLDTLYRRLHRVYAKAYPRFKRTGPRLWISEFTIQADHGSEDFNFFVSSDTQGDWIKAAFDLANKHPYISDVGWLGLLDEPEAPYNRTTGLLTYNLQRKPAYQAYASAR